MDYQCQGQEICTNPITVFVPPATSHGMVSPYQGQQVNGIPVVGVILPVANYGFHQNVYHNINTNVRSTSIAPSVTQSSSNQPVRFGNFYKNQLLKLPCNNNVLQIFGYMGDGAFGKVVLGKIFPTREDVAIKTLTNYKSVRQVVDREVSFLKRIRAANGNQCHLLQYHYTFIWKDQYCLVTEALQQSLHTFMKQQENRRLRLNEIRPIIKQIFEALVKLEELQIIHTDLKPENIMLVNAIKSPYRIKIIDFGNAVDLSEAYYTAPLQSRFYRSPEIILGVPYGHATDVWSVGCIAGELYLGYVLFKADCSLDELNAIIKILGSPDETTLESGRYTEIYFNKHEPTCWTIKNRSEYRENNQIITSQKCYNRLDCLDNLLYHGAIKEPHPYTVPHDQHAFVDLMKKMFTWNSTSRITPKTALQHSYITMPKLVEYHSNCSYAEESLAIMKSF